MGKGKRATYNFMFGILAQVLTVVLGVVVPRLVLTSYGSEVNGLINTVTQVYSYMGLLEAGVGLATVQALYKTISQNDRNATNRVLAATNSFYHKTGIAYLAAIVGFSILFPLIVSTEVPTVTVVLIIVFNGLGSVINYFFQGKYLLFLQAEGKTYVQTGITMATNLFRNVAKIVLMAMGMDVVFVQAISMLVSLIQMIYITLYIKRNYKWMDLSVKPDYDSISQSRNVLVHQISSLIFNNTDMIILSAVCGLKVTSVYSMYAMLFGMIGSFLSTLSSSVTFALGQVFNSDKNRYIKLHDCFEVYYMAIVFGLYSVANFFILPFLKLYTNGVNDVNYIDSYLPLLFISTYLLSSGRTSSNSVINFAGHFRQTQWRSILEAVINLTVSLISVHFFGIYGVLFGTVAALLYRSNDMIIYSNRKILKRSPIKTYRRWITDLVLFAAILFTDRFIVLSLDSYIKIVLWCVPYTIVTLLLYLIVNSIFEREAAKTAIDCIKPYLSKISRKKSAVKTD